MSLVTVEEEQGNAVFAVHFIVKAIYQLYITIDYFDVTNKAEHFRFKKWACHEHYEAYKDRLGCSVTIRIPA